MRQHRAETEPGAGLLNAAAAASAARSGPRLLCAPATAAGAASKAAAELLAFAFCNIYIKLPRSPGEAARPEVMREPRCFIYPSPFAGL